MRAEALGPCPGDGLGPAALAGGAKRSRRATLEGSAPPEGPSATRAVSLGTTATMTVPEAAYMRPVARSVGQTPCKDPRRG